MKGPKPDMRHIAKTVKNTSEQRRICKKADRFSGKVATPLALELKVSGSILSWVFSMQFEPNPREKIIVSQRSVESGFLPVFSATRKVDKEG